MALSHSARPGLKVKMEISPRDVAQWLRASGFNHQYRGKKSVGEDVTICLHVLLCTGVIFYQTSKVSGYTATVA